MNKKIWSIVSFILFIGILLMGMTGCGKKDSENSDNIKTEKINIIEDFAKYINHAEIEKVVDLVDIEEYDKIARTDIDKEQLATILLGVNVESYEVNNIRKATEEDIRNIAEEYGTYESFVETYKEYEQYVVDYKLSIDGSMVEAKDIFFIKEENGVSSLVTSKVWQGIISYQYTMMNQLPVESEI